MGDVAMVVPVVRSLTVTHPEVRVTVVTRPKFTALFQGIQGVDTFAADVDKEYKGLSGLWKLFRRLSSQQPDHVVDLHDHLRTRFLDLLFRLTGTPVTVFEKGREAKKLATGRHRQLHREQLPHTTARYRAAFEKAGYDLRLIPGPSVPVKDMTPIAEKIGSKDALAKGIFRVGIAPFSAHATKTWPLEHFAGLLEQFRHRPEVRFFLFGGGEKEKQLLKQLEEPGRIISIAGRLDLMEELSLMTGLHVMVCVDSSNMHLSGLAGIPVISIWGGTDPVTGFGPAPHPMNRVLAVPLNELACRPCSVYGRETCPRGDLACLQRIKPEQVAEALTAVLERI